MRLQLTDQQAAALDFLRERPGARAAEMAADARSGGHRFASSEWAHSILTRLEKRGYVRREGKPAKWWIVEVPDEQ